MKKFISVILAVMIVCAAFPISLTAFAAEDDSQNNKQTVIASTGLDDGQDVTTEPQTTEPATEPSSTEQPTTEPSSTEQPTTAQPTTAQPTTAQPTTEQPTTAQPTTEKPKPVYTPANVKNFKAVNVKAKSLRLNWSASKYATKYIIYRSVENSKGKTSAYKRYKTISSKSKLTLAETKLTPGRIYKYRIEAVRVKSGVVTRSKMSQVVALTQPQNVSKIKFSNNKENSVKVSWNKVNLASNYLIFRGEETSKGMSKYKLIQSFKGSKTFFTDRKLDEGKIYRYKVVVKRSRAGISRVSTGKAARNMTKLAAPKNFKVTSATSSSVSLDWSDVARATKYELARKTYGSNYSSKYSGKSSSYKDTSVSSGTDYTYRLRTVRKVGKNTVYSSYVYVDAATATSSIYGISSKSVLSHAILTWGGVDGASGYEVRVKKDNGGYKAIATVSSPSFISSKLPAGKTYKYQVCSFRSSNGERVYGATKTTSVTINANAYGNRPSGTWVEVCTEAQTLIMYVNNKFYLSTPVVTGNYGGALETTPGYHHVLSKQSPSQLTGSYGGSSWDVTVNYWLGFTGDGQGIHDSTWRGAYGGEIYKGDGSHGCVNTPMDKMSQIYSQAYVGMPVIVF